MGGGRNGLAVALAGWLGGCGSQMVDSGVDDSATGGGSDDEGSQACGDGRRPEDAPADEAILVPLVDHALWAQIGAELDPIAQHRPDEIDCGPLGWEVEFDGFEVVTISCNYMAAMQPTLIDLCAGDTIRFDFQHFILIASSGADSHMAILVGDQALLDHTVTIDPDDGAPAQKWVEEVEVTEDLQAGAPVNLHIHNHGFNTYKLLEVSLVLPAEDQSQM